MLKKIKHLTEKELERICHEKMYCDRCPLEIYDGHASVCIKHVLKHLKDFNRRIEVEIEVEENGK